MAKTFDIDSLVINRALRGTMFDKATGDVIFTIDQIKDPQLECSGEQVFVTDAIGQKIAIFDRSKDAKLTGSNALVNLGLAASQFGGSKKVASTGNTLVVPKFEILDAKSGAMTLTNLPKTPLKMIYTMNSDGSLGDKYTVSTTAPTSGSKTFSISDKTITVPTGSEAATRFAIWYDTESTSAISVSNTATQFAKVGRFDLEILCADICDTAVEYHAHIIFNNSKMDQAVTIDIQNEAKHGFTINAMQDYCDTEKKLFEIVVSE